MCDGEICKGIECILDGGRGYHCYPPTAVAPSWSGRSSAAVPPPVTSAIAFSLYGLSGAAGGAGRAEVVGTVGTAGTAGANGVTGTTGVSGACVGAIGGASYDETHEDEGDDYSITSEDEDEMLREQWLDDLKKEQRGYPLHWR